MKALNIYTATSDDEKLEELAKDCALNVVDIATFDPNENYEALKELLVEGLFESRYIDNENKRYLKRVRNILIIGAGASADVNKNIITAIKVPDLIIEKLDDELRKRHNEEVEKLVKTEKLNPKDPLTKFKALVKIKDEQFIRRELKALLSYRHQTSFFYEIVGHMFKHRMIDVIINYNFDEILDNIIEDEMGRSEYFKILMNGHCPDDFKELHIEGKLAIPVYIKPHGTISHVNSLKFTNEQYYSGQSNKSKIYKLLVNLLSENYKDNNTVRELPVNLIAAGYAFNDLDLKDIILDAQQNHSKHFPNANKFTFYIFDIASQTSYEKNSGYISDIAKAISAPINFLQLTADFRLGDIFKSIWKKASNNFKPEFQKKFPKDIARHELNAMLFHRPEDSDPIRYMPDEESETVLNHEQNKINFKSYLEKRILVELAIIIGKSDGIIHLNQIKESRVKKYCEIYFEKFGDRYYHNLKQFIKFFSGVDKYEEVMHDTFILKDIYRNGNSVNCENIWNDICQPLGILKTQSEPYLSLFRKICSDKLCTVNSDLSEYHVSEFNGVRRQNLLYSDIRWLFKFMMLFRPIKWNVLLCISENGEILNDDFYLKQIAEGQKLCIKMILSDYRKSRFKTELNSTGLPANVNLELRKLPWELHNKHVYIFLNFDSSGRRQDIAGIFYIRRLLSNTVNPVYIEGRDNNIETLIDTFVNYWSRSKHIDTDEEFQLYPKNINLVNEKTNLLDELVTAFANK